MQRCAFDIDATDTAVLEISVHSTPAYTNVKVKNIPIVALGDKGTEEEELKLLSSGAKDYLKRPLNSEIASIRLKNILNFCSSINSLNLGGEVKIADLVLNFDDFTAKMKGRPIPFTKEEMILLRLLAQRQGNVLSCGLLLMELVSMHQNKALFSQLNEMVIHHYMKLIRRKLGLMSYYIETIWGTGYRLIQLFDVAKS